MLNFIEIGKKDGKLEMGGERVGDKVRSSFSHMRNRAHGFRRATLSTPRSLLTSPTTRSSTRRKSLVRLS
mgnify:FL=1